MKKRGLGLGASTLSSLKVRRLGKLKPGWSRLWIDPLSQPLVKDLNRVLRQALARQVETGLVIEAQSDRVRSILLTASWKSPQKESFTLQYTSLLKGSFPRSRQGLQLSGLVEKIRTRTFSVRLNVFNRIFLHRTRQTTHHWSLSTTPDGQLLIRKGFEIRKLHHRWDQIQFLRLLWEEVENGTGAVSTFVWTFSREGRFSLSGLQSLLRLALHSRIMGQFVLPPQQLFPARVRLLLFSSFSAAGLSKIRHSSQRRVWRGLIRALELALPQAYAAGSFLRDWIESEKVRLLIRTDPVQSHLASRYPVPGRTDFQRRQVVRAYRGVIHLQALWKAWSQGDSESLKKSLRLGMDVPLFVLFHLLCPPDLRRSAAVLSGEVEGAWGDLSLLQM